MYMYTYIYIYICMYVCIYIYMYVCIYIYMYVCMYVCMYIYMFSIDHLLVYPILSYIHLNQTPGLAYFIGKKKIWFRLIPSFQQPSGAPPKSKLMAPWPMGCDVARTGLWRCVAVQHNFESCNGSISQLLNHMPQTSQVSTWTLQNMFFRRTLRQDPLQVSHLTVSSTLTIKRCTRSNHPDPSASSELVLSLECHPELPWF